MQVVAGSENDGSPHEVLDRVTERIFGSACCAPLPAFVYPLMNTRPLLEVASKQETSGSPQVSDVAPLITMRTPIFDAVPMLTESGNEALLQTGFPLASGRVALASSTEPSTVGGLVPSLTKTALTFLGDGSGTAIGSMPDS